MTSEASTMTTDPLREALAEALHATYCQGRKPLHSATDHSATTILAHPAVLAALDRSGPAEGLREAAEAVVHAHDSMPFQDGLEYAVGLLRAALAAAPSPTAGGLDAVVQAVQTTHAVHHGEDEDGFPYPMATCAAPECRAVAALQSEATATGEGS